MAIYHLSVKPISRSAGRSATAAAAYRSGERIVDERTGDVHDYTRKGGVESTDLVLPKGAPEWAGDRSKLWNAAEAAEKRKDACVAREYEVALPAELSPAERRILTLEFAQEMATREGCAVDVAIHAPGKDGDQQNHHAHILRTTRKVEADGLGAKLDTEKAGRHRKDDLEAVRERWAVLSNAALERAGHGQRIDHRTLEAQGIDREPTQHLGPMATGYERRTGEPSAVRLRQEREAGARLVRAKVAGELERQSERVAHSILDLSGDLSAARAARDRQVVQVAEAERQRTERLSAARAVRERQVVQVAETERQRIERMSAGELRAEIARLRPLPPRDLVERQRALIDARQDKATLDEQINQAQAQANQAQRELQNWRSAHPVRATVHDIGLMHSRVVLDTEQRRDEAQAQQQRLAVGVEAATQHVDRTRSRLETQLREDQAPVLAQVAELERIERHRQAQEQAERVKTQALDKALSAFETHAFKRQMKAHSYGDTGKQWTALPEPMRQFIEDFNRLAKDDRPAVLERMRDNLKDDPQGVETLARQLDQGKERGRGMSR